VEKILAISCKNTHFAAGVPITIVVFNDEHVNCNTESDVRGTVSLGKKETHSVLKCNLHNKFSKLSNSKYENHDS